MPNAKLRLQNYQMDIDIDVLMAIIPCADVNKLEDLPKKDPKTKAALELMKGYWINGMTGHSYRCLGCDKAFTMDLGGFAVMIEKVNHDAPGICAGVCEGCMLRHDRDELRRRFAKAIDRDGLGSIDRRAAKRGE